MDQKREFCTVIRLVFHRKGYHHNVNGKWRAIEGQMTYLIDVPIHHHCDQTTEIIPVIIDQNLMTDLRETIVSIGDLNEMIEWVVL
jgi:hypothetical protein